MAGFEVVTVSGNVMGTVEEEGVAADETTALVVFFCST